VHWYGVLITRNPEQWLEEAIVSAHVPKGEIHSPDPMKGKDLTLKTLSIDSSRTLSVRVRGLRGLSSREISKESGSKERWVWWILWRMPGVLDLAPFLLNFRTSAVRPQTLKNPTLTESR
jgi:hypothetical protein